MNAAREANVLVVEDDPEAACQVQRVLRRTGLRVRLAHDLARARSLLDATVDAVLLDYYLPDGTAEELLADLVSGSLPAGIVIASGGIPDAPMRAACTARADGTLWKPFLASELETTIALAIAVGRSRRAIYEAVPPSSELATPSHDPGATFLSNISARLQKIGNLPPRCAYALHLKVLGQPSDVAAREMGTAQSTYWNQIATAFERLGIESFEEILRLIADDLTSEQP